MIAREYDIAITGVTPLLLHHDNIEWADAMEAWRKDPGNKGNSKAGDDRTPACRWMGCLYKENGILVIPSENLMTVIREGGKRCPTGKRQGTFKAQSQSGIIVNATSWPLQVNGNTIAYSELAALRDEKSFEAHQARAAELGFELHVKRAKVGMSKHVRVRPRFINWSLRGLLTVVDEMITTDVLENILKFAGFYAGLGDWRPSSPMSPGPHGKFTAVVKEVRS